MGKLTERWGRKVVSRKRILFIQGGLTAIFFVVESFFYFKEFMHEKNFEIFGKES